MKRVATLILFFAIALGASGQQTLTKQDYLKKSKNQKIAAFSLVGGGIIIWLAGVSKYMNQSDDIDGGGETAMVIGGVAVLASIPFFIVSSKNKKKAMSMSFNNQSIPSVQNNGLVYHLIPSIKFKINL